MALTEKLFVVAQPTATAILWGLVAVSVISLGLIIERWITLRAVTQRSFKNRQRMREALQSYNLSEIEELARDKDSLEGRALAYGLRHVKESGTKGLDQIFNSYALLERPQLERSLNFLATVGSNAPFVGLLGTVLGIMKAFKDLAGNASGGNEVVMAGISEALVATAIGLLVAIPAVIAYNAFQRQVRQALQGIEIVRELCTAYAATDRSNSSTKKA